MGLLATSQRFLPGNESSQSSFRRPDLQRLGNCFSGFRLQAEDPRVADRDFHLKVEETRLLHDLSAYGFGNLESRAMFSSSTLTRGSPMNPNHGRSTNCATSCRTTAGSAPRARATRADWISALAGLIWGSRPLEDAVTAS